MLNTCKSNGNRPSLLGADEWRTGEERVRIYLSEGDNLGKLRLIPHKPERGKAERSLKDELASD